MYLAADSRRILRGKFAGEAIAIKQVLRDRLLSRGDRYKVSCAIAF
jgi:hypothetical protein